MNIRRLLILAALVSPFANAALPAAGDIDKIGDCPTHYIAKGNQCQPTAQASFAFINLDSCPDAYEVQGNYCVATAQARLAIRRAAMSCPSGFASVGNYCISEK